MTTGKIVLHQGERMTWYAVATVWQHKNSLFQIVCTPALFVVPGDSPLTIEEACLRGRKAGEEWLNQDAAHGPASAWEVATQSMAKSVAWPEVQHG